MRCIIFPASLSILIKRKLFTIDDPYTPRKKKKNRRTGKKRLPQGKSETWMHLEEARNNPIDPDSSDDPLVIAANLRVKREERN